MFFFFHFTGVVEDILTMFSISSYIFFSFLFAHFFFHVFFFEHADKVKVNHKERCDTDNVEDVTAFTDCTTKLPCLVITRRQMNFSYQMKTTAV